MGKGRLFIQGMRAHKHLHEPSGKVEDDLDLPSCKGKIRTIRECHDRECVIELLNRKRKVLNQCFSFL